MIPPEVLSEGLCQGADPEIFFPKKGGGSLGATTAAKELCGKCCARDACLEWALATRQEHGIWGALTAGQRAQLLAQRRRAG